MTDDEKKEVTWLRDSDPIPADPRLVAQLYENLRRLEDDDEPPDETIESVRRERDSLRDQRDAVTLLGEQERTKAAAALDELRAEMDRVVDGCQRKLNEKDMHLDVARGLLASLNDLLVEVHVARADWAKRAIAAEAEVERLRVDLDARDKMIDRACADERYYVDGEFAADERRRCGALSPLIREPCQRQKGHGGEHTFFPGEAKKLDGGE